MLPSIIETVGIGRIDHDQPALPCGYAGCGRMIQPGDHYLWGEHLGRVCLSCVSAGYVSLTVSTLNRSGFNSAPRGALPIHYNAPRLNEVGSFDPCPNCDALDTLRVGAVDRGESEQEE